MISHADLLKAVSYDPDTGDFTWREGRSNGVRAGQKAGYTRKDGYLILVLNCQQYLGHRVAWFFMTGEWPPHMIDHISGDPADNRFANLREASRSQNMMNMALPPTNTSGVKGVSWFKGTKKWEAHITKDRNRRHLGYFKDFDAAVAARRAAEQELFGEFARCA